MANPVPSRTVSVRLTDDLILELADYMAKSQTTISQTIRIALEAFFSGETRDRAIETAAIHEGLMVGFTLSKKRLGQMFAEISAEMDRASRER